MPFDPSRYLSKLKGKDYLEVKWRLLWLRTEHPDATIATELHTLADSLAVFKATVTLPTGASATGWGSETAADFRDFIEKAETKALGRALAALGYGTQFCEDFDVAGANGHTLDSPTQFPAKPRTPAADSLTPPNVDPTTGEILDSHPAQATADEAHRQQWVRVETILDDQHTDRNQFRKWFQGHYTNDYDHADLDQLLDCEQQLHAIAAKRRQLADQQARKARPLPHPAAAG